MLFLIDIHQNILSANALFKCKADCFSNASIVLKENCIYIEFYRNSSLCQFNIVTPEDFICPSTVSLRCKKPSGCALVQFENNAAKLNFDIRDSDLELKRNEIPGTLEVVFRFQIPNKDVIEKCILKKSVLPMCFKDVMYDKYKALEACKVICTNCGSSVTENFIKFQSVHKYYDWKSELDETSFCHKHDNDDATEIKANSLYIDDMYFYFHHSVLKYFKLHERNKTYKCVKCSSTLSFQKKMDNLQYIGFLSDKIMLIKSDKDENVFEKHKVDSCLLSFFSIIQDVLKTSLSPKLYLQSKVEDETDILLLWINSEKIVQFLLEESNENGLHGNIELKGKEVFKVLYCLTSADSELSKKWKHDFSVEFFQISDNMMNIVKDLLQKSSDYFSEWQESVKGFIFGYLPAEAHGRNTVVCRHFAAGHCLLDMSCTFLHPSINGPYLLFKRLNTFYPKHCMLFLEIIASVYKCSSYQNENSVKEKIII